MLDTITAPEHHVDANAEYVASRHPLRPLQDETDEGFGYNPPNISHVILFQRRDAGMAELLEFVRAKDNSGEIMDFRCIVPPPEGLTDVDAIQWATQHWGVDRNAGMCELVERAGYPGISFTTEDSVNPVLEALAAQFPMTGWFYFACAWQLSYCAKGEAGGGKFTVREKAIKRSKNDEVDAEGRYREDDDLVQCRSMVFGAD